MHLMQRTYDLSAAPCRNCKAPIIFARSLDARDRERGRDHAGGVPVALDAQPMPAGSIGSLRDYVIAAWNVPPDNTTFVVHWSDDPSEADEPIYRRHYCLRKPAGSKT